MQCISGRRGDIDNDSHTHLPPATAAAAWPSCVSRHTVLGVWAWCFPVLPDATALYACPFPCRSFMPCAMGAAQGRCWLLLLLPQQVAAIIPGYG
jgi:hypothetical protein